MGYKNPSIWGPRAVMRGIYSGREQAAEFRRAMENGGNLDVFRESIRRDRSGEYGFISPLGEVLGAMTRPVQLVRGAYHYLKNKRERPWDFD